MKPNPFASLNHFTVPVIRAITGETPVTKLFRRRAVSPPWCAANWTAGAGERSSKTQTRIRRRAPGPRCQSLAYSLGANDHQQGCESQDALSPPPCGDYLADPLRRFRLRCLPLHRRSRLEQQLAYRGEISSLTPLPRSFRGPHERLPIELAIAHVHRRTVREQHAHRIRPPLHRG